MNKSKLSYRVLFYLLSRLVRLYQLFISSTYFYIFGAQSTCRFNESCSRYFLRSVAENGFIKGFKLGFLRISKCHPWNNEWKHEHG